MILTNNELYSINGGSFISNIIRTIRIYIKFIYVKYFI